ncbi:MAG: CHAT domain-containing protein, partial [Candidatus Competibacterales bacterium]
RATLETPASQPQTSARELYRWLVAPALEHLANTETLVIIPSGELRLIPWGALYDGEAYLIERLALAYSPGPGLLPANRPLPPDPRVLVNAISEPITLAAATPGTRAVAFAALPATETEVSLLTELFPRRTRTLVNDAFNPSRFARTATQIPFDIIHIASHAQFGASTNEAFVLAYNERLTLGALRRLLAPNRVRRDPVALLTLSACETARGDDRAPLGLAGIALAAGAQSVVASLWAVEDQATAALMAVFYRQLKAGQSRGEALRTAQLALLQGEAEGTLPRGFVLDPAPGEPPAPGERGIGIAGDVHPFYWAPFLLMGSWR